MNLDKIKEFIALRQELQSAGVVGVSVLHDVIHVKAEVLVVEESLEIEHDSDLVYPYRISTVKDGVEMFAIMTSEDLEKLFPQFKGYLVEDVILDGMGDEAHAS